MIDVYTANTPNGIKVPIALEELAVRYRLIRFDLGAQEQKRPPRKAAGTGLGHDGGCRMCH